MTQLIILLLTTAFLSCWQSEAKYDITCIENGCSGTYTGPEFVNGSDVAHQFSNHMARRVCEELKELYKQKKYTRVVLGEIKMTTKGMNFIGDVTYSLEIPFESVSDPCEAFTSFDHRGGWGHKIKESSVQYSFRNKSNVQLIEKNTPEGLQEFWIQFQHRDYQSQCESK